MTLMVLWWFFVPFGQRGRVLNALPANYSQCPFIPMTDTDVTFPSCYNIVGHALNEPRHMPQNPLVPWALGILHTTVARVPSPPSSAPPQLAGFPRKGLPRGLIPANSNLDYSS
jgi:hypothetical protein